VSGFYVPTCPKCGWVGEPWPRDPDPEGCQQAMRAAIAHPCRFTYTPKPSARPHVDLLGAPIAYGHGRPPVERIAAVVVEER
jgi:hypothetical protein